MPTNRENDRRDKALESIAKHLGDISDSLKKLAKNSEKSVTVFNHLAEVRTRPDPFEQPQEPQPDPGDTKVEARKDESDKSHPYAHKGGYFARSEPGEHDAAEILPVDEYNVPHGVLVQHPNGEHEYRP